MKMCITCKIEKEESDFKKTYNRCKSCIKEYLKTWNKMNSSYRKNYDLKRNYNISFEEYNCILNTQKNCCAICKINKDYLKKDLEVDHDHKTGKIRGLLCNECNLGIGKFKDNSDLLLSAVHYVSKKENITRKDNNLALLGLLKELIYKHEDMRFSQLLQNFGFVKPHRPVMDPGRIDWQNEFYVEPGDLLTRVVRRIDDIEETQKELKDDVEDDYAGEYIK